MVGMQNLEVATMGLMPVYQKALYSVMRWWTCPTHREFTELHGIY
jgi:hypothetical protein